MNIAIYDTDHFETTHTLLQVLNTTGNQVTLLVTATVAEPLKALLTTDHSGSIHWNILPETRVWNSLSIYRICRQRHIECIYFNTVSHHHLFFGVLCRCIPGVRKVLTVHDANSFFKPAFSLTARGLLKWLGKKILADSVDGYATLLSATKKYIAETYHPGKPIVTIPGSFFNENEGSANSSEGHTTIVIPGSIDVKRRNYDVLFETLSLLSEKKVSLEIVLLGGATTAGGAEVIRHCRRFATKTVLITTYEEAFVSQPEYDRQLRRCDFIYAPLQAQFNEESTMPEIYGLTKSSGSFFDAIRFAKPLLLSANIPIPDEIAPQTLVHTSASALADFISSVGINDKRQYREDAIRNAGRFTLSAIRDSIVLPAPKFD